MPKVVGEILGGLQLGLALMGYFSPDAHDGIFAGKMMSCGEVSFIDAGWARFLSSRAGYSDIVDQLCCTTLSGEGTGGEYDVGP